MDLRLNVVSIANLVVLVGLLFTALGTWYGLVSRVDAISLRVEATQLQLKESKAERRADIKALQEKDSFFQETLSRLQEQTSSRLATLEAEVRGLSKLIQTSLQENRRAAEPSRVR